MALHCGNNDGDCLARPWTEDVNRIALELRSTRADRQSGLRSDSDVLALPSRHALAELLDRVSSALFPRHFGHPGLDDSFVDDFVRENIDRSLHLLCEQICCELRLSSSSETVDRAWNEDLAKDITREFASNLPKVHRLLKSDIYAAYRGDPAARSVDEVLLCYPGVRAITRHRIAHELYRLRMTLLARIISEMTHSDTGIDIHPGAEIGGSFFIDHGTGVVIGETSIIGANVRLYQAVTLGAKRFTLDATGALVKGGARHPIIEDDVVIYAGATILGPIIVGKGSRIGGNVWLTRSVLPGSNITQAQAKSETYFIDGSGI